MDEINLAFANTQKLTLALCAEPSKDLYEYVASQIDGIPVERGQL